MASSQLGSMAPGLSPRMNIGHLLLPLIDVADNRTYLKEEVCFLAKQSVAYFQFITIREFAYFSQKLLELIMDFCLLNLQNQDKNSVGYLGKNKPRFSSKGMWLTPFL